MKHKKLIIVAIVVVVMAVAAAVAYAWLAHTATLSGNSVGTGTLAIDVQSVRGPISGRPVPSYPPLTNAGSAVAP